MVYREMPNVSTYICLLWKFVIGSSTNAVMANRSVQPGQRVDDMPNTQKFQETLLPGEYTVNLETINVLRETIIIWDFQFIKFLHFVPDQMKSR